MMLSVTMSWQQSVLERKQKYTTLSTRALYHTYAHTHGIYAACSHFLWLCGRMQLPHIPTMHTPQIPLWLHSTHTHAVIAHQQMHSACRHANDHYEKSIRWRQKRESCLFTMSTKARVCGCVQCIVQSACLRSGHWFFKCLYRLCRYVSAAMCEPVDQLNVFPHSVCVAFSLAFFLSPFTRSLHSLDSNSMCTHRFRP